MNEEYVFFVKESVKVRWFIWVINVVVCCICLYVKLFIVLWLNVCLGVSFCEVEICDIFLKFGMMNMFKVIVLLLLVRGDCVGFFLLFYLIVK